MQRQSRPRLVNYDTRTSPEGIHTSADQWSLGPSLDVMVYLTGASMEKWGSRSLGVECQIGTKGNDGQSRREYFKGCS